MLGVLGASRSLFDRDLFLIGLDDERDHERCGLVQSTAVTRMDGARAQPFAIVGSLRHFGADVIDGSLRLAALDDDVSVLDIPKGASDLLLHRRAQR
ncbi:MAG: hypothetical protein J0I07_04180 [Myxococcales bacterium]|nr:hypothetical protein [Myxococcales bacterium]